MKAFLRVETRNGTVEIPVSVLEGASSVLSTYGFYDLDVDPYDDHVSITATSTGASVTVSGKSLGDACEKLIERIL